MQYQTLEKQLAFCISILEKNKELMDVLSFLEQMALPNYYIAAGAVFQTIWNYQDGRDLNYGIKDIDVIYYDSSNLSVEQDLDYYQKIQSYVEEKGYPYQIDVSNEARMHLWKEAKEGKKVLPYKNSEDAICRWIATVHAIGITLENKQLQVYAPYGLSDLLSRTIRPIQHEGNSRMLYEKKAEGWQKRFSHVIIIPW